MRSIRIIAADLIERTPPEVVCRRLTGRASPDMLLAPTRCGRKWAVLDGIEAALRRRCGVRGRLEGLALPEAVA
jgi:radical SAM superfamily enzyme